MAAAEVPLRTVSILRGFEPQRSRDHAEECWAAGMDLVEVPVQGEAGWASLAAVAEIADGRLFGAGTVLMPEDARRALDLGATVVISPGVNPDVVDVAARAGAIPLPGVLTPSDVGTAVRHGARTVKLFPASVVGSGWLPALRGPFPGVGVVAVGGIGLDNAAEYLRAGAVGVGFGGSIVDVLRSADPAGAVAELHELADLSRQRLASP
ncbi:bifunctional 4-hydroxy-2-oxoglutarate aldolase/2-dehydro-3-deoxy-phosphogluconate aldolase [Nocardioides aquiterrae]|uniref:2-dehydro-3-deoxy-6-phosphogalactonate aldolase n=1 Tax=Nocardioides aquiterrae TaxID=203799 RepID=A0ABN1UBZ6_9ACTN